MSYKRAEEVLPREVLELLWQYVDGQTIYVPRRPDAHKAWGDDTGTRRNLMLRNRRMFEEYRAGASVGELAGRYFLTEKSVRRIIRDQKD